MLVARARNVNSMRWPTTAKPASDPTHLVALSSRLTKCLPESLRCQRHLQRIYFIADTSSRQRIEHGVDDRRRRADCSQLANAFYAERIVPTGHRLVHPRFEIADVACARQRVIHEASRQRLSRIGVVNESLVQCLADALCGAAVELSHDDQRIDDATNVVHR